MTKQVVVMHLVVFSPTSALSQLQGPKSPPILLAVDTRFSESSQLFLLHDYALFFSPSCSLQQLAYHFPTSIAWTRLIPD